MKFGNELKLLDVAEGSGTSMSTVSRYFNRTKVSGMAKNSIETYLRAHRMEKYIVDEKEVSAGKKRRIGLLVPDLTSYTFTDISASVAREAERRNYEVITLSFQGRKNYERQALRHFYETKVEGIIYSPISYFDHDVYPELRDLAGCPMVIVNRRNAIPGKIHIYEDNITAGYEATKYMLGLGRTRIAFMLGSWQFPYDIREMCEYLDRNEEMGGYVSIDRLVGYRKALREAGIPFDPSLLVTSDWSNESASRAAALLMGQAGTDFDGFIGCSDMLAASMMNVLLEHGLSVPNDVSVIGWGNSPIATIVRPQMTTMLPNTKMLGTQAVVALDRVIHGEPYTSPRIQVSIIPRNSTYKKE